MSRYLSIKDIVKKSDLIKFPFHSSLWIIKNNDNSDNSDNSNNSKPVKRYYKRITGIYEHKEK